MKVKVKEIITPQERAIFAKVGSIGGKTIFKMRGKEYMAQIGRRGGNKRAENFSKKNKKTSHE